MGAKQWLGAVVIAWGVAGCAGEVAESSAPELGSRVAELTQPNGRNLNGRNLNGRNLNGRNLNGPELGKMLVSVNLAGAYSAAGADDPMSRVWLQGSVFHGFEGTQTLAGMEFLGARFTGNLGDGGTVQLRVDDIQPDVSAAGDVWTYKVSFLDTVEGVWKPVCQGDDGSALGAIPVMGRWDYRQGVPGEGGARVDDPGVFTFACEGAAIAKCVRFGYKPWAYTSDGRSMADHHQACTRMVRADFCGDGTSYTQEGNWVNLYDAVGVQEDTEGSWLTEAEWTPAGARCVTETTRAQQALSCPSLATVSDCGVKSHFRTGTFLMSEVPPVSP
jgi:hypothetical protein